MMLVRLNVWGKCSENALLLFALLVASWFTPGDSIPRLQAVSGESLTGMMKAPTSASHPMRPREQSVLRKTASDTDVQGAQAATDRQILRMRGGTGPRPELVRDNFSMQNSLKKYFSQVNLPPSNPAPLLKRESPRRGMLKSVKWSSLLVAVLAFAGTKYGWRGEMEFEGVPVPAAKQCLAIVLFVSTLWATEAIPLHITSLLIPLLTVLSGALLPADGGPPYTASVAAKEICGEFFSPTILLFLAGFSIGAVLEKQKLSKLLATAVLRPFGNKPETLLLGMMMLGTFMSMWISNIPSSVLCTSLAQPILAQLPAGDPFAKALLLGIAFSNNIGGMTTPIASPQNVVSFGWCEHEQAGITFGSWMAFTMPYCSILLLATWGILRALYPPMLSHIVMDDGPAAPAGLDGLPDGATAGRGLTAEQAVSLAVTAGTIACWSFWGPLGLEKVFGAMGVVGLIPVILFFSLGLLDAKDFNRAINWSVLVLIGGGLALGHLMERSQLLDILSVSLQSSLKGGSLWTVLAVVSAVMAVFSNFVSSVVAAVITLPVIAQVGTQLKSPGGLIIASTLVSTAAMALPVSSFPNANSFAVRPASGGGAGRGGARQPQAATYLQVQDYIVAGGMVTGVALILMVTWGYASLRILKL